MEKNRRDNEKKITVIFVKMNDMMKVLCECVVKPCLDTSTERFVNFNIGRTKFATISPRSETTGSRTTTSRVGGRDSTAGKTYLSCCSTNVAAADKTECCQCLSWFFIRSGHFV